MWFFGLIVVLLIGAVAVVASGRWGGMSAAYADRPDMSVPARQALTAADLETARFGVGLRGYRMDEVDTLLERVAREVAERDRRIADLERAVTPILHGPEGAGFTSRSEYTAADFDDTGIQEPSLVGGDFPEPTPAEAAPPEPPAAEPAPAEPASPEPTAAEPTPAQAEAVAAEPAAAERTSAEAVSPEPTVAPAAAAETAPAEAEALAAEPAAEITAVDQPAVPANPAAPEPAQASTAPADAAPASAAPADPVPASAAPADTESAGAAPAVPASEVGAVEAAPQPVAEPEQAAAPAQQASGESAPQSVAGESEQPDEREQHEVPAVLDDQPETAAQVPLPPLLQELVHTNYDDEPEPEPWFQAKEPPPDHNSLQAPDAAEDEPGVNGDEASRGRHSAAPDVNVPQRPN